MFSQVNRQNELKVCGQCHLHIIAYIMPDINIKGLHV